MAASDPGGSLAAKRYTVENFPHVVGKLLALIAELIDGKVLVEFGIDGKEKFWTSLNLPGHPGLGIKESGEDWKGPRVSYMSGRGKGPMYLPLVISFCMVSLNSELYVSIDGAFIGVCTCEILGKSILKPNLSPSGMVLKRSMMPALRNSEVHASGLYGVIALALLCSRAALSSVG